MKKLLSVLFALMMLMLVMIPGTAHAATPQIMDEQVDNVTEGRPNLVSLVNHSDDNSMLLYDLPGNKKYEKIDKAYRVVKVTYVKDEYSEWYKLNEVFTARRKGETAHFNETKKVEVSSSLTLSVPIKAVSVDLGFSVSKSVSTTIRGTDSAPLNSKESAAFYYRKHWKVYNVEEEVIITRYSFDNGRYFPQVSYACQSETIRVAQKLDSNDYGWFYADNPKALTSKLNGKYCDDNYSCKVKG